MKKRESVQQNRPSVVLNERSSIRSSARQFVEHSNALKERTSERQSVLEQKSDRFSTINKT